MIVFLTLCYCGLLFLLVKLGVIRLNLWWKLSPLVWMLLLLIVLFIPMQWGAPSGSINVYQPVIEIIPNVSGEVIDVPAQGLLPMKQGDVLFRIDPVPYQAAVDQLEAQLAQAEQNVEQLEASADAAAATVVKAEEQVEVIKAEQESAAATVAAAEAAVKEAEALQNQAGILVADLRVQLEFAASERNRIEQLAAQDAATDSDVDRVNLNYKNLESQFNVAEADVEAARQTLARAQADARAAEATARTVDVRLRQQIDAELPRSQAQEREARLAAESMIGEVHTSVAQIQAQLDAAEYDLRQTTVLAPTDGYVVGATLQPGQRVTNFPVRSWMAFVDSSQTRMAVGINQNVLRHVEPGQHVEVIFKLFPGQTYQGVVEDIALITPSGQLQPAGTVPQAPGFEEPPIPFGVIVALEEGAPDVSDLPGGAVGTAAIYTSNAKPTHLIRKVMLRMESWMNYVVPW